MIPARPCLALRAHGTMLVSSGRSCSLGRSLEEPMDLNEIARNASQSHTEVAELQIVVRQLQAKVDRHALVIQVLKDMLLATGKAAEDDFLDRLERAAAQKTDA